MNDYLIAFDDNGQVPRPIPIGELVAAIDASLRQQPDRLLSRRTVAERLHVNVSTLWRWARTGYLVPVHIGRSVWYRELEIRRLECGERDLPQ